MLLVALCKVRRCARCTEPGGWSCSTVMNIAPVTGSYQLSITWPAWSVCLCYRGANKSTLSVRSKCVLPV
jgi:hypothetical protein